MDRHVMHDAGEFTFPPKSSADGLGLVLQVEQLRQAEAEVRPPRGRVGLHCLYDNTSLLDKILIAG